MRPPHRAWAFRLCRGCWFRPAKEWHHCVAYARWGRESVFRSWVQRRGPVVALCRPCHHRITRWDRFPSWPTAAVLVSVVGGVSVVAGPSAWLLLVGLVVAVLGLAAWLPLVTFAGLLFGWARNIAVVVVVVLLVRVFG